MLLFILLMMMPGYIDSDGAGQRLIWAMVIMLLEECSLH